MFRCLIAIVLARWSSACVLSRVRTGYCPQARYWTIAVTSAVLGIRYLARHTSMPTVSASRPLASGLTCRKIPCAYTRIRMNVLIDDLSSRSCNPARRPWGRVRVARTAVPMHRHRQLAQFMATCTRTDTRASPTARTTPVPAPAPPSSRLRCCTHLSPPPGTPHAIAITTLGRHWYYGHICPSL